MVKSRAAQIVDAIVDEIAECSRHQYAPPKLEVFIAEPFYLEMINEIPSADLVRDFRMDMNIRPSIYGCPFYRFVPHTGHEYTNFYLVHMPSDENKRGQA